MSTMPRLVCGAYALATRLYPPGLRANFGDEMRAVFADAVAEAARDNQSLFGLYGGAPLRPCNGVVHSASSSSP